MANGKIKADTLEHSTAGSLDTQYVVNGSAKAWASYSQHNEVVNNSFNESSVTDISTGDFDLNYISAMSSQWYSVGGIASATRVTVSHRTNDNSATNGSTTTVFKCKTAYASGTGSIEFDTRPTTITIVGELA
jgi:hypothetical protein